MLLINPVWLVRNLRSSWRHRTSNRDFLRRMLWVYAAKLPRFARRDCWQIGFRYGEPIGHVDLSVRDNGGADAFVHGEVFEHEYYNLPLAMTPATILDLGANAGFATVYFSRRFRSAAIACVEPVPSNLQALERNLGRNGIHAAVFAAAADVQAGNVQIELAPEDYGHRIATERREPSPGRIEVEGVSVPTIMTRLGWERIGLLKVDIEGHERKLLCENNEWLRQVDALSVEWHDDDGEVQLSELASQFDFSPPRQLRGGIWFLARAASPASLRSAAVTESLH